MLMFAIFKFHITCFANSVVILGVGREREEEPVIATNLFRSTLVISFKLRDVMQ